MGHGSNGSCAEPVTQLCVVVCLPLREETGVVPGELQLQAATCGLAGLCLNTLVPLGWDQQAAESGGFSHGSYLEC